LTSSLDVATTWAGSGRGTGPPDAADASVSARITVWVTLPRAIRGAVSPARRTDGRLRRARRMASSLGSATCLAITMWFGPTANPVPVIVTGGWRRGMRRPPLVMAGTGIRACTRTTAGSAVKAARSRRVRARSSRGGAATRAGAATRTASSTAGDAPRRTGPP